MSLPRFTVGQRVRIAARIPPVHHRVPAYAKGRVGRIERQRHEPPHFGALIHEAGKTTYHFIGPRVERIQFEYSSSI